MPKNICFCSDRFVGFWRPQLNVNLTFPLYTLLHHSVPGSTVLLMLTQQDLKN